MDSSRSKNNPLVLHVTGQFPGSSETFITRQIAGLVRRGAHVEVLAFERGGGTLPDTLNRLSPNYLRPMPAGAIGRVGCACRIMAAHIHRLPTLLRLLCCGLRDPHARYLTYLLLADGVLRAGPFDLIHAQFGHLGRMLGMLREAGVFQAPLVVAFRGGDSTVFLKKKPGGYASLYRTAAHFFAVSETVRDIHLSEGCPPDKITVLRSGLDPEEWPFWARTPPREVRLLGVGRLVEKKGFKHAIEALALLREAACPAHLEIAGEGPLRGELEELVRERRLSEAVTFHGWTEPARVRELMAGADLLLVPSLTALDGDAEGIPNVVKEAMLMGLPVIASRHGGITELVKDRETGLLVAEGDPAGLAGAVKEAMENSEAVSGFALQARSLVVKDYAIGPLTEKLMEVYNRLCPDIIPPERGCLSGGSE